MHELTTEQLKCLGFDLILERQALSDRIQEINHVLEAVKAELAKENRPK